MSFSVSIGIPVYNEEKNIGNLLNYIHNSKFDFELKEILVVCSGCTDKSVEIVKSWSKKERKIRILVEKTREGKFSAINKILKQSHGNYIILIDADTLPKRNSLNELIKPFTNPSIGAVSGRPLPIRSNSSIVSYFQYFIWTLNHEISFSFNKLNGEICAIKKDLVKEVPEKIINDDAFLAAKISLTHNIAYQQKAESIRIEKLDFNGYVKKRRRIAQGFKQLSQLGFNAVIPMPLIVKHVIRRITKEPQKIFYIVLAVMVETYCNILAFFDIRKGNLDYKWNKLN